MPHPLVRKLEVFGPVPDDDKALIERLTRSERTVASNVDIISERAKPVDVNLVIDGYAFRYKVMPSGQRQIVAFLVPGDFCDLHVALLGSMDHSIAALTNVSIVEIPRKDIELLLARPAISRAMLMATLVDEAVLREWLANNGRRSSEMRIAHFFCEWHRRLRLIGRAAGNSCEFPLTQDEIGDAVGLSTVHVNRCIHSLRERGLVVVEQRKLVVTDLSALYSASGFDPLYLHSDEDVFDRHA